MLTNPWKSYSYVLQKIPIQRETPGTAKTLCLISADGKNMISLWGDFDERQNFQKEKEKRNLNKLNVSKWKDFYMQIIKIYELICVSIATAVNWLYPCWNICFRRSHTCDVIFHEFTEAYKKFYDYSSNISLLASFGLKFIIKHGALIT